MGESSRIRRTINVIWREHHKLQTLYQFAMKMDISTHLRKICCKGHIASIVFKKEIAFIYDHAKCCLTDGDLSTIIRTDDIQVFAESEDYRGLIREVRDHQYKCIEQYRNFAVDYEVYDDVVALINDHIEKLQELNALLDLAMSGEKRSQKAFTAVA